MRYLAVGRAVKQSGAALVPGLTHYHDLEMPQCMASTHALFESVAPLGC